MIKINGIYSGYVYIDSGIDVENNVNCLSSLEFYAATKKYGMIMLQTDTDTGFGTWFDFPSDHYHCFGQDYVIPVGKAANLHFQYFDERIRSYFGHCFPDIFTAFCSESVFSFLCASLKLQWLIVKAPMVKHFESADGRTSGFKHSGGDGTCWNNLMFGLDMRKIVNDPVAKKLGLGYEECHKIMMHDQEQFTEEGFAKNEELKEYIKNNLFLQPNTFNYSYPCKIINKNSDKPFVIEPSNNFNIQRFEKEVTKNFSIMFLSYREKWIKSVLDSIVDNTSNLDMIEIHILIDSENKKLEKVLSNYKKFNKIYIYKTNKKNLFTDGNFDSTKYINYMTFSFTSGKYVFLMNDDAIVCTKDWDKLCLEKLENFVNSKNDRVVLGITGDDTKTPGFQRYKCPASCFPIISRGGIEKMGYVFDPIYCCNTADTHITHAYWSIGKAVDLTQEIYIRHRPQEIIEKIGVPVMLGSSTFSK
jgi:hypothetical protein